MRRRTIDVSKAIEALEAGRGDAALDMLLAQWRADRASELATAIVALGDRMNDPLTTTLANVCTLNLSEALEVVLRLERVPADPRIARAVIRWMHDAQAPGRWAFRNTASKPLWTIALKLMVASGDASLKDDLVNAVRSLRRKISARTQSAWLDKEARRIELAAASDSEIDPIQARALMNAIDHLEATSTLTVQARRPSAGEVLEESLLEAIHDDPESDAARAVYADWLLERGDPRGELISLQLERHRRSLTVVEQKRELALLRAHAKAWVGAPAAPMRYFTNFVSGLPVDVDLGLFTCFDRGFLARYVLTDLTARALHELAAHPTFIIVEDFVVNIAGAAGSMGWQHYVDFLAQPSLKAMRRLLIPADMIPAMAQTPNASRIRYLKTWKLDGDLEPVYQACMAMPSLRRLIICFPTVSKASRELIDRGRARLPGVEIEARKG